MTVAAAGPAAGCSYAFLGPQSVGGPACGNDPRASPRELRSDDWHEDIDEIVTAVVLQGRACVIGVSPLLLVIIFGSAVSSVRDPR